MSVNVQDDQWNAAARDAGLEPVAGAPLTAEERAVILCRLERGYVWGIEVRTDIARLLAALDAAEAELDSWVTSLTLALTRAEGERDAAREALLAVCEAYGGDPSDPVWTTPEGIASIIEDLSGQARANAVDAYVADFVVNRRTLPGVRPLQDWKKLND